MTLKKEKQSNRRSDLGHNANEWGKPTKTVKSQISLGINKN